jgi:predicted porin
MKKSTLAMAIAAALAGFGTVAQADTTLYGSARVSVDYSDVALPDALFSNQGLFWQDYNDFIGTNFFNDQDYWDVFNNASRLGVRGEEDLGGGLSAIYQYEFGVDITEGGTGFNSNRPKWVGLKGSSWGSVTAGTQWTPYYNVIGIGDIFNSSKVFTSGNLSLSPANGAFDIASCVAEGASTCRVSPYTLTPGLNTYLGNEYGLRMDNSVIYTSPNWSGFNVQAMLVMNGLGSTGNRAPNVSDGVDLWNVSASYKNGPFFLGGTYMAINDSNDLIGDDLDQWGLAFGYNAGPFTVSLAYEDGDLNSVYIGTSQNIYVTGQYTFGNNVIRAAYGYLDPDDSRLFTGLFDESGQELSIKQGDLNNYVIGYQYNFSKRTRVWAEYAGSSTNGNIYGDANIVSIGTRHDF